MEKRQELWKKVSNTLSATPGNAFGDVRPTKAPVAQLLLPAQRNGRPCTSRNFLSKSAQPFLPFSPSGFPFRCRSISPDGTAKSVTGGTRHCAGARRYRPCHNGRCQDVGVRFFGCLTADQLALPLASFAQRTHSGTRRPNILLLRSCRLHAYLIGFAATFDMEFDAAVLSQTIPNFLFNGYFIIIMENEKFYKTQATKTSCHYLLFTINIITSERSRR